MHNARDASDGDIIPREGSIILFDGRGALAFMERSSCTEAEPLLCHSLETVWPEAGRARLAQAAL
jgi:hypothetical protein